LTRLSWRFRYESDDGHRFPTAVEGSLALNGVIENKNSTAVAAGRYAEDGGMTAFQAANTQAVAVQQLVDRLR